VDPNAAGAGVVTRYWEVLNADGTVLGVISASGDGHTLVTTEGDVLKVDMVIGRDDLWVQTKDGRRLGTINDPTLIRAVMP